MAVVLNIESGAGNDSSCNSYVSLAECSNYHLEMGNDAWALAAASPDDKRNAAIVRACRAIDRLFGKKFAGVRKNFGVQAMEWPRRGAIVEMSGIPSINREIGFIADTYVISDSIIPAEVKKACFEAALIELNSPGDMIPDLDRGGKIASVTAGDVSVSFEKGASPLTVRTAIESLLLPYFKVSGNELELG